jgi:hypothetical protein
MFGNYSIMRLASQNHDYLTVISAKGWCNSSRTSEDDNECYEINYIDHFSHIIIIAEMSEMDQFHNCRPILVFSLRSVKCESHKIWCYGTVLHERARKSMKEHENHAWTEKFNSIVSWEVRKEKLRSEVKCLYSLLQCIAGCTLFLWHI